MPTKTVRTPKVDPTPELDVVVDKVEETLKPFDEFMKHQRNAVRESGEALKALLPDEVIDRTRAAYKESLEGYRGLVNSVLDDILKTVESLKIKAEDKN